MHLITLFKDSFKPPVMHILRIILNVVLGYLQGGITQKRTLFTLMVKVMHAACLGFLLLSINIDHFFILFEVSVDTLIIIEEFRMIVKKTNCHR